MAVAWIAGLALVSPHLFHGLWQDEAKTLRLFASGGFLHPFTDYSIPNNHVLFSAALSLWRSAFGEAVATLRGLPLLCYAGSLLFLAAAAARLGGRTAGWFACLLLASSHVAQSFAVELRGYGVSWLPISAALWILPAYLASGRAGPLAGYALCSAASVALVPSNALAGAVLAAWALADALAGRVRVPARRLVAVALAPLLGGLAYFGVWEQLLESSADWSYPEGERWSLARVFLHWLWATGIDFVWALPLLALGAAGLVRRALRAPPGRPSRARGALWLAACCALLPPVAFGLAPRVPPPRLLIPLLPLWYAVLALFLAEGWRLLFRNRAHLERVALPLLLVLVVSAAAVRERGDAGFAARVPDPKVHKDLYHQMYHYRYDPEATRRALLALADRAPGLFVTDYHGLWGLGVLLPERFGPDGRSQLVHFRAVDLARSLRRRRGREIFLVTTGLDKANRMLAHHGLPALAGSDREADTGFFEVYRVRRPDRGPVAPEPQ